MTKFKAFRIDRKDGEISAGFEKLSLDDLTAGDTIIRAQYSGINYKDALAATGKGRILRKFPLNGGIDVAGEIVESANPGLKPGDAVLVTGCGLSEDYDGGYSEYVRVAQESVVQIPDDRDTYWAMSIGTAGFTAALAIHRMEENHQHPDNGPIVVTGATGGVGSLVVDMLAGRGYEVVAVTGKHEAVDYLKTLGATEVLFRDEVDLGSKPLEKGRWGGAVDNVGGEVLTWLTRSVNWWGNIASIGLVGSYELHTTVMPFILRGINLLGINSDFTPRGPRQKVWARLAGDLAPRHLDKIATRTIPFNELSEAFDDYIAGRVIGRTVVRIS